MDLNAFAPEMMPENLVDEKLIRSHSVLPLIRRGNRLFVAMADPTNLQALDEIKFHTGLSTEAVLVEESSLRQTIDRYLESQDTSMKDMDDSDLGDVDFESGDDEEGQDKNAVDAREVEDAPIVKYVNKLLLDAIKKGASDIHFEP